MDVGGLQMRQGGATCHHGRVHHVPATRDGARQLRGDCRLGDGLRMTGHDRGATERADDSSGRLLWAVLLFMLAVGILLAVGP